MERTELISAMRIIKEHCGVMESCQECPILKECCCNLYGTPYDWELEGDDE